MRNSTSWVDLGVDVAIASALEDKDITSPFPVQALTIPDALEGLDVCGKAKTGSGKTLAFGIPMIQNLHKDKSKSGLRGLILVPTRELATQVCEELEPLAESKEMKIAAIYGGANIDEQIKTLKKGVAMVVATPGRMIDLLERQEITVQGLEVVVVDEADRMADMGFLPQVEWILRKVERKHQTLLFSATLDGAVNSLIQRYQSEPTMHEVEAKEITVEEMTHRFIHVHQRDKVKVAAAISRSVSRTLMFSNTKAGCDRLVKKLLDEGIRAQAIHGDLRQNIREKALDRFAQGKLPVLVATDVAARGIHVDDVEVVIHYDPPSDHKTYLHRSGRTARAGTKGLVVTLCLWDQELVVKRLQKRVGLDIALIEMFSNDPRLTNLGGWDPGT
ncbi:MAG: DEAD/DEAH box helicase [Acidimicrobiales bacterium]|jgi:superfamily II DNA/RNA helicase|nr:DEAD/DEAH box helicase [Acidimicrobiales bacterium]MDP6298508.1 DEAD/DEAH box helicase [Acidimicrobiales bacterium]HJM28726.1 DEAD/DEAH box helicase [Acidimicrobiales bacterium]HJM96795.1 DEAD/DEAH box helicase [Acidimicrobiales bacterium]